MIDKIKKNLCTGCNACYSICPVNCISMLADCTGFQYPSVDYDKCIKCKACVLTCPSLNKPKLVSQWDDPKVYAAWSLDEEVRFNSTSGGIFTELANYVISKQGIVVGAIYNENHLVEHAIAYNKNDIEKLRQSKYLQSDIGFIFKIIEEKLTEEKLVAFCGSPCQVAGLLNYLGRPYDKLITFDFVCRGTNSPKAYIKYIEMLEKKYNSKISRIWFKNKTYGWKRFSTKVDFVNKKMYLKDRYSDLYMRGYIEENLYMRSCCFDCKYKEFPRIADISLADFWGIGKIDTKLDTDKGTSLVMVNSKKGNNLFQNIKQSIFTKETRLEDAIRDNNAIIKSAVKNPKSEEFLKMLDEKTFNKCFREYAQNVGLKRLKFISYTYAGRIKRSLKL